MYCDFMFWTYESFDRNGGSCFLAFIIESSNTRGNCCELKGRGLKEFQHKLKGVKYILIEEFSVIDKEMFRWVDRKLRQARVNLTYNFVFYFS